MVGRLSRFGWLNALPGIANDCCNEDEMARLISRACLYFQRTVQKCRQVRAGSRVLVTNIYFESCGFSIYYR